MGIVVAAVVSSSPIDISRYPTHHPLTRPSASRSYNGVVPAAEEEDHPLVVLYSPPSTSISLVLFPSFLAFSCPLSPVPSSSSYPYAVICVCSLGPPVVVIDILRPACRRHPRFLSPFFLTADVDSYDDDDDDDESSLPHTTHASEFAHQTKNCSLVPW